MRLPDHKLLSQVREASPSFRTAALGRCTLGLRAMAASSNEIKKSTGHPHTTKPAEKLSHRRV
jgi:hypothetical protein